jgi:hypothetical protein
VARIVKDVLIGGGRREGGCVVSEFVALGQDAVDEFFCFLLFFPR